MEQNNNNHLGNDQPSVINDPRFQAGRKLVERGLSDEGGVEIFSTLLEEVNNKNGTNDSIESAPAYYEYGNALHYATLSRREERDQQRQQQGENDGDGDNGTSNDADDDERKPAAAAYPKVDGADDNGPDQDENGEDSDNDDDLQLALEMMESAYSILQLYEENALGTSSLSGSNSGAATSAHGNDQNKKYVKWVQDQLPRVMMGIGDVLSSLGRFADATDIYTRALERRKEQLKQNVPMPSSLSTRNSNAAGAGATAASADSSSSSSSNNNNNNNNNRKSSPSLELLKSHRLVCEAAVATAQALLDCPPDEDVVTTETKSLLVRKEERVSYIEGYYWQARDALQELLLSLAELEGQKEKQLTTPAASSSSSGVVVDKALKEDVSHVAVLVMALGEALAAVKEEQEQSDQSLTEPTKKRAKR